MGCRATGRLESRVEMLGELVSGRIATGGCRLAPPERHSLGSLRLWDDFDLRNVRAVSLRVAVAWRLQTATLSAARDEFTRAKLQQHHQSKPPAPRKPHPLV